MKIVVLTGGLSTERDVSLSSGAEICKALLENGHEVLLLDVFMGIELPEEGIEAVFHLPDSNLSISEGIKVDVPDIEAIKASRKDQSPSFFGPNVIPICQAADICFLGLHGGYGEDGRLQAALDLLGIRYTGPSSLGNALAMDKGIAKHIFTQMKIPTPQGLCIDKDIEDYSLQALGLTLPLVIKPNIGGSSIGVYIVKTEEEYVDAIEKSFAVEDTLIIESYIKGREFACGVLGKTALPVIEIIPKSGFFDYANKYQSGFSEEICPADLPPEITKKIQSITEQAMSALQLSVYSRADFLVDENNNIYCLEMNTLPGMTPSSLLPKEAKAVGISYQELCEKIITISIDTKYKESTLK